MQRDEAAAAAAAAAADESVPVTDIQSAVVTPGQLGLVAVAPIQTCQLKEGAAARCLISFQGIDLDAILYDPDRETYLVFSLEEQRVQVAFDVHVNELGALGPAKNWVALAILVLMLVGIASERVHRM